MPKVIAITSEKGGVGKSTLAVHLTGALTDRGLNAVLIDEDGRIGSSLRWSRRGEGLDHPGLAFPVLTPDEVRPKRLAQADAVLIDTEGRPRRKELRQLAQRADLILVPGGVSPLELEATRDLLAFFHAEAGDARQVRAVLTRVPPVGRAGEDARADLRETGAMVCNTLVRHYAVYQKAAEVGALCRDLRDPRAAAAWNDILALSREVL